MSNEIQDTDRMMQSGRRDESALRDELSVFGLSDKEINTYLALLSRGEATTSVIAEDADVTQRAVYDIAERLEQRGLVYVKDHASPTTVRALPPSDALGTLSERLDAITPALEDRFSDTVEAAPEIRIVKSRETALKRLRESVSEAANELLVAVPANVFPAIEDELRAAHDRGVFTCLLIGMMADADADADRFAGTASVVRYWDAELPFLYAADNESAMIGDAGVLSTTPNDTDAVTVSQRHLSGSIVGLFLSAYWPAATELHVDTPAALPHHYNWFRQAVVDAFLHYHDGRDVRAEVETRNGGTVLGELVEVRQAVVGPSTNAYTLEMSLILDTTDGLLSFGGPGAFMEDYEVASVTLHAHH